MTSPAHVGIQRCGETHLAKAQKIGRKYDIVVSCDREFGHDGEHEGHTGVWIASWGKK